MKANHFPAYRLHVEHTGLYVSYYLISKTFDRQSLNVFLPASKVSELREIFILLI